MKTSDETSGGVAPRKFDPEKIKAAMSEALRLAGKMGAGAMELVRRLKKDRSPQAMLATLEESLGSNRGRRESVATRLEKQYAEIAEKKKIFTAAPPARKRILEAELKTLLAGYQATERELRVLLENERILAQTQGRIQEVLAYGMAGLQEAQLDELADQVDACADDAEGRVDAARDLDRAGKRRERESDQESFLDQLSAFDVPETAESAPRSAAARAEGAPPPAPDAPQPEPPL